MRAHLLLPARLLALVLAGGALIAQPLPVEARVATHDGASQTQAFDEAWRIVRDKFYDPKLKGLDWKAVGDKYRDRYAAAKTEAERSAAINAMLAELGSSHTHHYSKDETAYYELADIFSYHLRHEIPKYFSGDTVTYAGIGIFTKVIDGKTFISGVFPELPAAKAGLLLGDEIVSADSAPFEPVASFRGKVGKSVTLRIRRAADGPVTQVSVEPKSIEPDEAFVAALKGSARIIEANGRRIGYVHVWSYAGQKYQDALEELLSEGKLKDADALIWDLRDGWGGAQPRFLDIFNPYGPTLTLTDRDGDTHIDSYRWHKPVAALVNGGTRSGKEVLSYGFKKNGFGQVIGERTAGALLAATAFLLSDGSLLILPVEDAAIEGVRLEGTGVVPTVEVPFDIRYAGGKDPQLDKAIEILAEGA